MKNIYLDNAATTKPTEAVIQAMHEVLTTDFYNPSSLYNKGIAVEKKINAVRNLIATEINGDEKGVFFTSCGTEASNMIIKGVVERRAYKSPKIVTTAIEHPSVLDVFKFYEEHGIDVVTLPVDKKGYVDQDNLEAEVDENTIIVSIIGINNEIGVIQDLENLGKIIKKNNRKCFFHVDYVQGFMKKPIDVKQAQIDGVTLSAHKIGGPKGCGVAYINPQFQLKPLLHGGGQEFGQRSGTENVPGIMGFGAAVEGYNTAANYECVATLRKTLLHELSEKMDTYFVNAMESPYILSLSFPGIRGEVLLHSLEAAGIYVSTGSACSIHKKEKQHVLKAIGLPVENIEGTIRISFSPENNPADMSDVAKAIAEGVEQQKRLLKNRRGY